MVDFPHFISGRTGCSIPRRCVYFDTETTQTDAPDNKTEQRFKLGVAISKRLRKGKKSPTVDCLETFNSNQLCEWILSKTANKERLHVFSANIWFDIRVSGMLRHLNQGGWECTMLFVNGMTLGITFKCDARTVIFLNIQNYFRVSVAELGESLRLPKLDITFEEASNEQLMTYCRRDTEIIYQTMDNLFTFIKDYDLGNFGFTFPAIAFNSYRKEFMPHKILIHKHETVTKLERKAYFGGRVECFKLGTFMNKNLVQIDLNSMYPHIMKKHESPIFLKYHCKEPSIDVIKHYLKQYCITTLVKLNTNEPVYPVRLNERCIYPTGTFETYLSTASLQYAIKHKHIIKVIEAAIYSKANIFEDYVDFFYKMRLKYKALGNDAFESLCKYFLNGLYGKFAQRGDKIIEENECDKNLMIRESIYDLPNKKHLVSTKFFGLHKLVEKNVTEGKNSVVAIAAHVTDHARMFLWKFIKWIKRENIYYLDTDCIILDRDKFDISKLPIDIEKLGFFKIERESDKIKLRGLKDYEFAGKTKIKGISHKATKKTENIYEQTFFPGIYTELHEGIKNTYTTRVITKKLTRKYTKGIVKPNGDVIPFVLKDGYL